MKIYTNFVSILIIIISLSSCCTKVDKSDSGQDGKNGVPKELALQKNLNNLSPGTAYINGEVISYSELPGGLKSKIRVNQINGYGGSTPPLSMGSEIICDISGSLIQEKNQPVSELFKKGNTHEFIIQYQFGVANGDSISDWKATNFK